MSATATIDIAILGAVPQEIEALVPLLNHPRSFDFLGQTFWKGSREDLHLVMGTTGLGKVNAAAITAALLERFVVSQIWSIGSAGAYAEGPLEVGDVLVAQKTICGDEGILTEQGVAPVSEIGIPIAVRGNQSFYNEIPLEDHEAMASIRRIAPPGLYRLPDDPPPRSAVFCPVRDDVPGGGTRHPFAREDHRRGSRGSLVEETLDGPSQEFFQLIYGPSLTVGMSSGDKETALQRFQHYGAFAENMEGSAIAQTCFLFDVPVLECRGMSNIAGDRNKERWQLMKAVTHCHGIILSWLSHKRP